MNALGTPTNSATHKYLNQKGVPQLLRGDRRHGRLAGDPTWDNDAEMKEFLKFCKEWFPEGNPMDASVVLGYVTAHMMVHILKNAGDNLTRENILKVATHVRGLKLPLLLPGVQVNISPDDYSTFNTFRTARFDGKRWALFGDPIIVDGK